MKDLLFKVPHNGKVTSAILSGQEIKAMIHAAADITQKLKSRSRPASRLYLQTTVMDR